MLLWKWIKPPPTSVPISALKRETNNNSVSDGVIRISLTQNKERDNMNTIKIELEFDNINPTTQDVIDYVNELGEDLDYTVIDYETGLRKG